MNEPRPLAAPNPVLMLARQAIGLKPMEVTAKRKYLALLFAALVDVAQATVIPTASAGAMSPIQWGVDIATTVLLVAILGWNWRLLAAFVFELIPAVSLFPTWSALILTITALTPSKDSSPAPLPQPTAPPPQPTPGGAIDFSSLPPVAPPPPGAAPPGKFPGSYHQRSR
ncbi:MAG: hypothetical protein MUF64_05540 [Polyangiaceae bacterium]|nr:hypothetical protein [Polyangiaceae bacterium]